MDIVERLKVIRDKVEAACRRAGRDPEEVKVLGASKKQPPEKIRAAFEAGLRLVGENYVQEARDKREALADLPLEWHLIGSLQTNKARLAVKLFDMVETVDRPAIVKELAKRAEKIGRKLPVLLEVNVGGEETKAGVAPEDLFSLAELVLSLPSLELRGLMTIPPYREDSEDVRPYFAKLRGFLEELKRRFPEAPLSELSMGMSHDFEVAIEEGATIVRVGTALFGPRPAR
jgi:pyridoxal phosphate enzyme (YggS family)